jgi:phage shock protein E
LQQLAAGLQQLLQRVSTWHQGRGISATLGLACVSQPEPEKRMPRTRAGHQESFDAVRTQPRRKRRRVAEGALLLDVRTRPEYADAHVDGATNIPVQELAMRAAELGAPRRIVVYCRSGARSAAAAQLLRGRGHDVLDVGPMSAY